MGAETRIVESEARNTAAKMHLVRQEVDGKHVPYGSVGWIVEGEVESTYPGMGAGSKNIDEQKSQLREVDQTPRAWKKDKDTKGVEAGTHIEA